MHQHERATFDTAELAVALSYYDLGVVESITDFPRGSRRSPKVGIVCERGKFLLKRRTVTGARLDRVRFVHRVQAHLIAAGFPVSKLVPSRNAGPTFVQIGEHLYELFEFVTGHSYQYSTAETHHAGAMLARFHQATGNFAASPKLSIPRGDYHDSGGVRTGLCAIGSTLSSHDSFSGDEAELATLIQFLLGQYDRAADAVNAGGLATRPERIIHSDWHPGNLLFRNQKVVAVVDCDSLRYSRLAIDVANGALQFSIIGGGDPDTWPDHLDEERLEAFLAGYESLVPISNEERRCFPWLMTEALITECVPPITETGSVGRWAGFRVLQMARRKLTWLESNGERLFGNASTAPKAGNT